MVIEKAAECRLYDKIIIIDIMKRNASTSIIALFVAIVTGIFNFTAHAEPPLFVEISIADNNLFNVGWINDRIEFVWGLMNESGEIVQAPEHEEPLRFNGDFAIAIQKGKYGIIDKAGRIVVPFKYDYIDLNDDYCILTKDGIHQIQCARELITLGKIDQKKTNIKPLHYAEGLVVAVDNNTGKYGYLNTDATVAVPFEYDYANSFSDGLAGVALNDRVFYIDKSGKRAFEKDFPKPYYDNDIYCEICDIHGGLATVIDDKKMMGLIDKSGNLIVPYIYDGIDLYPDGTSAAYREGEDGTISWDILDNSGNKIATIAHDDYYLEYDYTTGIYVDMERDDDDEKVYYYFANKDGRLFNGQKFEGIANFVKGIAFVVFPGDEGWSVINTDGDVIFREIANNLQCEESE